MLGFLFAPLAVLLAAFIALRGAAREERGLLFGGLVAHVLAAGAIVLYHQYVFEGGDMLLYHELGRAVARLLDYDPRWFAEVGKLALHLDNDLRLEFFQGSSSGTMVALMTVFVYLFGDNIYVICLLVSMFGYVGQVSMYRAIAWALTPRESRSLLIVFMLLPSVVFWSSGFIKEAVLIGFLGLACRAGASIVAQRRVGLPLLVGPLSLFGIALFKPYILFPLALAVGGWVYAGRAGRRVGLGYKILGIGVAAGGVITASLLFPDFAVGQLGANLAHQQFNYTVIGESGSYVDIGDDEMDADPSLARQVKYFPLALLNALARPFLFEARSASTMVAAVEMTVVVVLAVIVLRRASIRQLIAEVTTRPPLMFSFVFVLTFSLAVGLATRNLGTLSRYRAPVLPLYVGVLMVLRTRFARREEEEPATEVRLRSLSPAQQYLAQRRAAVKLAAPPRS